VYYDEVKIIEMYCKEKIKDTKHVYVFPLVENKPIFILESELTEEKQVELRDQGYVLSSSYPSSRIRIRKKVLGGHFTVIKEYGNIGGEFLPIIPFYGEHHFLKSELIFYGVVRILRDITIMQNLAASELVDSLAKSHADIPIMYTDVIQGHDAVWGSRNTKSVAYLPVNKVTDNTTGQILPALAGILQSPQVQPSLIAAISKFDQDMDELSGGLSESQKVVSNVSAQALELQQTQIDRVSMKYIDGFKKTIEQLGRVFQSKVADIYGNFQGPLNGRDSDGSAISITTMDSIVTAPKGINEANLKNANHEVVATVGSPSVTQRERTFRNLLSIANTVAGDNKEVGLMLLEAAVKTMGNSDFDGLR
ncbi:MAG: portal protein, partial [Shewanella oncorhynchi]